MMATEFVNRDRLNDDTIESFGSNMDDELKFPNNLIQHLNASKELDCAVRAALETEDSGCPVFWDGILCWPSTPPGIQAVLKCFDELKGVRYDSTQNATRLCLSSGTWANYTDYAACTESESSNLTSTAPADVTSLIYLGGYSLSLVALMLAVFIFLYFKDLRCLRNTIHTNLMCTYILAGCIWILNLTLQMSAQADTVSCLLLVLCLHYFYLTNFFWMLVEGLYLYMLVVETFTSEKIKLRVYGSIGWGLPAVFIMIWILTRSLTPIEVQKSNSELGVEGIIDVERVPAVCLWMREHSCDWIYKAPAMVGLALNLLFLIRIMWVLITKLRSANTLETEQYRKATKALLVLIPLLGITYILVLTGPTEGWSRVVFDYARAILLSTQGFTVALFYCFLNTEVQNTIRHHVDRWKTRRSIGGGNRYHCSYSKDWSPRTRTESIRIHSQPHGNHKRESSASETTTTTLVGTSQRQSLSVNRTSLAPSPLPHQNCYANNQESSPLTNGQNSLV